MKYDKDKRKKESKSLISKIMTFGARDKAAKAPREKYLDKKKIKKFSLKRKK